MFRVLTLYLNIFHKRPQKQNNNNCFFTLKRDEWQMWNYKFRWQNVKVKIKHFTVLETLTLRQSFGALLTVDSLEPHAPCVRYFYPRKYMYLHGVIVFMNENVHSMSRNRNHPKEKPIRFNSKRRRIWVTICSLNGLRWILKLFFYWKK